MNRNLLVITGFAVVALGTASAVHAESWWAAGSDRASTNVRIDDLNLATPAGQQTLNRRISAAVSRVCGNDAVRELYALKLEQKCRHQAWSSTEIQMARTLDTAGRQEIASASGAPNQSSLVR
jgi:UrcA family protein